MKAKKGNFNEASVKIGPWVAGLGRLNKEIEPYLQNENVGLKWSKVKKGEKKTVPTANSSSKTLGILIYGKTTIEFPEVGESVTLSEEGDYIFLPEHTKHMYEFLEDSLMVSIRWPAVDDQY